MSLARGTNILNYEELVKCIKKYEKDDKIFDKALILFNLYTSSPSWPRSVKSYIEEGDDLLGAHPYDISRSWMELKPYLFDEENSKICPNFKRDLAFFSKHISSTLMDACFNKIDTPNLKSISSTLTYDRDFIIKIARDDNNSLELKMGEGDILNMIKNLKTLL